MGKPLWTSRRADVAPAMTRPLQEWEIEAAYQLVLGRDADPSGRAAYLERARGGLSLADFVNELLASDEYRSRPLDATESAAVVRPDLEPDLISPADVTRRYSLEELNATSDEYYARVTDPAPLMAKPFAFLHETPQMLHDLGLLLTGMRLGKSMTVLDFGAGTCWLSRILAQLNCRPICCDVSAAALDIGRRLFEALPLVGTAVYEPTFLRFDGRRIDLPDESVDRIVCFDAFHHVPNPEEVLVELARVLRPGGIAGFSEPGIHHSRSPQSQYEMRHHRVLENDIDLKAIDQWARAGGFTRLTVQALVERELTLEDYAALVKSGGVYRKGLRDDLWASVISATTNRSVFYLHKGDERLDSRTHDGLAHEMTVDRTHVQTTSTDGVTLRFSVANVGRAKWLHVNDQIFGIVRLGSHAFREPDQLIDIDFSRHALPDDVPPGGRVELSIDLAFPDPGDYRLVFDLVAEGVTWFENLGSRPVTVHVTVT